MDKSQMKCGCCDNQEKDIIEIFRESGPSNEHFIYYLICGHEYVSDDVSEFLGIQEFIRTEYTEYKDNKGKLLSVFKTKISGETKRPARETIKIDHENRSHHHIVEEQNEKGEWEIVYNQ
ncbi:MAG: hypothetical protein ABSF88_09195 [Candidatus Aminicenantales bacterium]